ncbi:MAG: aminotransferase class V-fold PLP-dependent enzyme [Fimbriimonadaceae bacterium]|nr:aminotransferase class V-fold PLP-dependent enzyme [Fimbriimonadaceae bacterium]
MNLPPGPMDAAYVERHVNPLFTRVLARNEVYLANHSLGRPLDRTEADVQEGVASWYGEMDSAWDAWMAESDSWRAGVADLVGLPSGDAVVPRASCGQALRAVLNSFPTGRRVNVVTTDVEFDSIDFVLRSYHEAGRADVRFVASGRQGGAPWVDVGQLVEAVTPGTDLVVVSAVVFMTGQVVSGLDTLVHECQARGTQVLVDAYHAVGVLPYAVGQADFAMGGSYKYLRGGPGCCWLAVHPRHLASGGPRTLDTGWFAKADTFGYARPEKTERKPGGDGWLESTPAVLPVFQARAGLEFTRQIGPDRLRDHGLRMSRRLRAKFLDAGIPVLGGEDADQFGAFVCVGHPAPSSAAQEMRENGVNTDARGAFVRFGPDILTTDDELDVAVRVAAKVWR